jgi:two-component system, sensor histidine kinase
MDFLTDRYSFQFSEPQQNEFGDIERTFNALAQRAINNMDELKALDQAKSEFLNIASHELRTPMTSIKGSLSLLTSGVMGALDQPIMNLIQIAETETDRLIRLTNDLLDLAKIEARHLPLKQDWVLWNKVLESTGKSLAGLAHKAGVKIIAQPLPNVEAHIDRDRIQQVLMNLVSNAIKFSPPGGTVFILSTLTPERALKVDVEDQGPGISPAEQELIFQKFRQGTNAENPLVKGTGLGLAIAKALVEEHGGIIGVRSAPGRGSIFSFTILEWRLQHQEIRENAA